MKIYNMIFEKDANHVYEYSESAESKDEALTKFAHEINYASLSLEPIEDSVSVKELTVTSEISRTDAPFAQSFAAVDDGDDYVDQWSATAKDAQDNSYVVVWEFLFTKGDAPSDDDLDFWADGMIALVTPE